MKHSFSITAAAVLFVFTSCSQAFLTAEEYGAYTLAEAGSCHDSISHLTERARQGDGQAYLLLAQCYHEGYGVEHDFLMTWAMTQMAAQYGAIGRSEDFFAAYPDNDPDRMLFEAMDLIGWHRYDEALSKAETLARQNAAYAHFVKGGLALEQERKGEALSSFSLAAEEGFTLAEMAVAVAEKGRDGIYDHASRLPLLYCMMPASASSPIVTLPKTSRQLTTTGWPTSISVSTRQACAGCSATASIRQRPTASRLTQLNSIVCASSTASLQGRRRLPFLHKFQ